MKVIGPNPQLVKRREAGSSKSCSGPSYRVDVVQAQAVGCAVTIKADDA